MVVVMSKAFKELQKLSLEELKARQKELKLELLKLKAQAVSGAPPKNVALIRNAKRMLARVNYLLRLKQGLNQQSLKQ